jgi:carbonic anhydrase/acetyltransferase-like protein (isoleucine patch superfamily)
MGLAHALESGAYERSEANSSPYSLWPVAGKNLLQNWVERIERLGIQVLGVEKSSPNKIADCVSVLDAAKQGVEKMLFISLRDYAEIDLTDLVYFHRQTRNRITEAIDAKGPLGVQIVDRALLPGIAMPSTATKGSERGGKQYRFAGYVKRMMSGRSYRDLVSDALGRRCALRPHGSQINEDVWISENALVADSVRFTGPCYVGAGTELRPFVSVGSDSSIEENCTIDCGTAVEGSSILPQTYLAAGLKVQRCIVDMPFLEHLDSGTIVDLEAAGLARRSQARSKSRSNRDSRPPITDEETTVMIPPGLGWNSDVAARIALSHA